MNKSNKNKIIKSNYTKEMVESIYLRNYGTQEYYKRSYCDNLIYTEGIKDFQISLNTFWIVDWYISHIRKIIKITKAVDDGFFVGTIKIKNNNTATFEIFREGYITKNNKKEYNNHITIIKEKFNNVDLPKYDYKFYLILTKVEPIFEYCLMLTSEY